MNVKDDKPKKLTVYAVRRCKIGADAVDEPVTLEVGKAMELPRAIAERLINAGKATLDPADAKRAVADAEARAANADQDASSAEGKSAKSARG